MLTIAVPMAATASAHSSLRPNVRLPAPTAWTAQVSPIPSRRTAAARVAGRPNAVAQGRVSSSAFRKSRAR